MSELPEVKRFDCTSGGAQFCQGCYTMTQDVDGDYVEYTDYESLRQRLSDTINAAAENILEMQKRLEAAEKDKERLEFLIAERAVVDNVNDYHWLYWPFAGECRQTESYDSAREAIDTARAALTPTDQGAGEKL
jgi:hypothetical protein